MRALGTATIVGLFLLAPIHAFADGSDANAPSNPQAARPDGTRTRAPPARKDKGAALRAKGWNEMTAEEQQEAHQLWLARPKKWDEMTPAEQNAAHKAWLFSSGDFGRGRGRSSSVAPKASAPKQNVPAN